MAIPSHSRSNYIKGLLAALFCYGMWGVFPLYWKLLGEVPPLQILAHRILWSFFFLLVILLVLKNKEFLHYFLTPKIIGLLMLTGVLIGGNWLVYIYAINNHHIVDASLGYYINPM